MTLEALHLLLKQLMAVLRDVAHALNNPKINPNSPSPEADELLEKIPVEAHIGFPGRRPSLNDLYLAILKEIQLVRQETRQKELDELYDIENIFREQAVKSNPDLLEELKNNPLEEKENSKRDNSSFPGI